MTTEKQVWKASGVTVYILSNDPERKNSESNAASFFVSIRHSRETSQNERTVREENLAARIAAALNAAGITTDSF